MANYGVCACGCGEAITQEGNSYAGNDSAERGRHRARAAYKRKQGDAPVAGTREAMATLGLADDVTMSDLAAVVASATAELSRRVAGVDTQAVQRQIDAGLAEARTQVETAEGRAAKAESQLLKAAEELKAAVQRADQADSDAADSGTLLETEQAKTAELNRRIKALEEQATKADERAAAATTRAERAEAALDEQRAGFERAVAEARRSIEAETSVRLAEQRTEHERALSGLREQIVRLEERAGSAPKRTAASRSKAAAPAGEIPPATVAKKAATPNPRAAARAQDEAVKSSKK